MGVSYVCLLGYSEFRCPLFLIASYVMDFLTGLLLLVLKYGLLVCEFVLSLNNGVTNMIDEFL